MTARGPRGVTLPEAIVLVLIVGAVLMTVLMVIPRSREASRLNTCTKNLGEIGQALAQYDGATGHLPPMPASGAAGPGPLMILAEQFGTARFRDLTSKAKSGPGPIAPRHVAGFACPADPNLARPDRFPAPVSYRGNAGPGTDGTGGAFAFGAVTSIADAEAGSGKDFTAAFAERLLGSGGGDPSLTNDYRLVRGPIADSCADGRWGKDAGSSWAAADWRSTLYNHALPPNGSPSCVAEDGQTARMGASSGHPNRVNVLMLGGSVRGVTPGVSPTIWRELAGR